MDFSLKQALEVLIAMLVVALVFMVTAYLLKNNGSRSTSTNNDAWKGVNAVEKKSRQIDAKDRFMVPVTYEDWVIDKDGNRRVKIGSRTVNKRIGEYAHGGDIGSDKVLIDGIKRYIYIKDTSIKVDKSNNTVYRYFYYNFDTNIVLYMKDGTRKYNYWGNYNPAKGYEYSGTERLVSWKNYIDNNYQCDDDNILSVPYGSTVKMVITYVQPSFTAKETEQSYKMISTQDMYGGFIKLYEK